MKESEYILFSDGLHVVIIRNEAKNETMQNYLVNSFEHDNVKGEWLISEEVIGANGKPYILKYTEFDSSF